MSRTNPSNTGLSASFLRLLIFLTALAIVFASCESGQTLAPNTTPSFTPTSSPTPAPTNTTTPTPTSAPSPTQPGAIAPVISGIELFEEISSGLLTVYIHISFTDADGDANYVDYELVSSTSEDVYVEDGEIDIPGNQQASEAVVTGTWNCGTDDYSVTMQVSITDAAGNRSNFMDTTIDCWAPSFTASVELEATDQLLISFSEGWDIIPESILLDQDNRHIAFVVIEGDKLFVSVDGERGPLYEDVKKDMLFSPDGEHFVSISGEGEKVFALLDGVEHRRYDEIGDVIFSPDSRHLAYRARLGEVEFVVLDGVEQKHYGFIVRRTLTFSPDSSEIAYGASYETFNVLLDGTGTYFAVVNGQEGKHYGGIGPSAIQITSDDEKFSAEGPTYSPDGKRMAYIAYNAVGAVGAMAVIDGMEGETYGAIVNFIFSPDSQHYAYIVDSFQSRVVLDGIEGAEFDSIRLDSLLFSSDGQSLAFIASDEEGEFVVVNGEAGKKYRRIFPGSLRFSPDSRRFMYVAVEDGLMFVVIDGHEDSRFDGVVPNSYVFSPDSQHLAYAVTIAEGGSVLDYVVIDGALVNSAYNFIPEFPLAFSPDGLNLAFVAKTGDQAAIVINQMVVNLLDYVFLGESGGLVFDSSTSFHFIGLKNDGIYLVECEMIGGQ